MVAAFIEILDRFHPKKNARARAIELVHDIARRDGMSPEVVLEKVGIAKLLERPGHPLENFDELVKRLEALRYPLWTAKKERLNALCSRLVAKTGVTATYPPFAEGDTVTLSFTVKSITDLTERLTALNRERETVEKILRELGE